MNEIFNFQVFLTHVWKKWPNTIWGWNGQDEEGGYASTGESGVESSL